MAWYQTKQNARIWLKQTLQINCLSNGNYRFEGTISSAEKCEASPSSKYMAIDIPEIKNQLESQKIKHRHHPGKRHIKCVILPDRLVNAAKRVLTNHNMHQLLIDSKRLNNILKSRKLPVEEDELRSTVRTVEVEVLSKENVNVESLSASENETRKMKNEILSCLRRRVHHWKPVQYDSYHALLYLTRRMAPEYAALKQVFLEIKHHSPDFFPQHVCDFGSGIGSVPWVANVIWGEKIKDYLCIDSSSDMLTTAELLLQDGHANTEMFLKNVFFRQFLPASDSVTYDLVVSSYSLMELPSKEDRLKVIDILWKKCNKYLVIVEYGTYAGYTAVIQARDYILKLEANEGERCGVHVAAPCPHDASCPRFMNDAQIPCTFEVLYRELTLDQKENTNTERFSYVILKKERRSEGDQWPRVVSEILPRSRHVVCRMCCPDGQLHEVVFTKSKHGRHLYRCVRSSHWGDMIPATIVSCPRSIGSAEETIES